MEPSCKEGRRQLFNKGLSETQQLQGSAHRYLLHCPARKRSDYRIAGWLGSLQLTTKQLAEENGFKQLLLSGHKQDVCHAGCKPQTE